jgi:signal transduction histidine kinase/CHASE3 domain sensor protein
LPFHRSLPIFYHFSDYSMIFKTRNLSILRYALIVFLTVVMSATAFYLYYHYRKAAELRYNFSQVIQNRGNSDLIDSCVVALYNAGNNSRMYALSKEHKYYVQFSQEINFVRAAIHKINAQRPDKYDKSGRQFDNLLQQKSQQTQEYFKLLSLTDSLLKSNKIIGAVSFQQGNRAFRSVLIKKISNKIRKDSLNQAALPPPVKQRFFSRVFSALSRKKSQRLENAARSTSMNTVKNKVDSIIKHTTFEDTALVASNNHYKNLFSLTEQMKKNELKLYVVNTQLINAIINDLRKYKKEEQIFIDKSKVSLDDNLQEVIYDFGQISTLFFMLLAATVILLLFTVWKTFQNEENLVFTTKSAQQDATSKMAFLASMSHEIRTPLNSVIGFSEQLMESKLDTTQTEQIKAVSSSARMLLHVVNEILDFSKYETGKMQIDKSLFKPYSALEDVFTNMEILASNKFLKLIREINIDPEVIVIGDQLRLKQVIINLLNNAIKFTPKGRIYLKAWMSPDESGAAVLSVQVIDSGIGIDQDQLPLIFEEFTQVEAAQKQATQKGTGLGLAICKKIIELQGGTIGVTSKSGEGSVFSFQLAYELAGAADQLEFEIPLNIETRKPDLEGKHVLVADDNDLNLLLVTTILKKWKVSYDTAINGADAMKLIKDNRYDLLLTDIEMPLMGGVELSKSIREFKTEKSKIPILALTANALKEDTDKYLQAGMNGVIVKPITENQFMTAVKEVLECSGKI